MATNTGEAKSKSKYTDYDFFADKCNMNANVSFTICPNVPEWLQAKCHISSYPSNFAHTLLPSCGHHRNYNQSDGWNRTFLLHFKDGVREKKVVFLCIYFYQKFSYIQLTFPQTSKWFLSNGTKNMHFLASGPELQAVSFGYVILGENWKKGGYH